MYMEHGEDYDFSKTSPWIIRFVFDKEKILDNGLIMDDIYLAIMKYDSSRIRFVYSDDNSETIIGRISILSDSDDDINGVQNQSDIISMFKNIEEELLNSVIVKGTSNITNIVMNQIPLLKNVDNEIVSENQWILESDGCNLLDVISNPYVDSTKTHSNDILEIYEIYGIEGARSRLITEITEVIDSSYINNRHIELLCDMMTSSGQLLSVNRQGISRGDVGPLGKCSFEDTTDQLIKSSIFGEKDKMVGVSSNIMLGQKIKSGTNVCEIFMDEDKWSDLMKDVTVDDDDSTVIGETIDDMFDTVDDDVYCNDEEFKFSFE
jgi:DNA-directed RNA polymerase II subunit RPB1